jgi:inosine/xanthosine triphosphatase
MKYIAVGSENPVKIKAVQLGFEKVFPDEVWQAIGYPTKSGVSAQPMSPKESMQGATNRARQALAENPEAKYGVGLEGGLEEIDGQWFDCGWCIVVDRAGIHAASSSGRVATPEAIMKEIRQGKELGDVIDTIFKRKNAKQAEGHFGLMTNNAVTRTSGYTDAVCLALARFLHPHLFTQQK